VNFLAAYSLWWRELIRFFRQPSRVLSAVATPLLFWVLIGTGLSSSFRLPGGATEVSYLEYFFPGTLILIILFASIFSTISVIEDRQEGFLQGALVAPMSRWALVLGKVAGGSTLAVMQGAVFLVLAPLTGICLTWSTTGAAIGVLALLAFGLTSVGFAFAWKVNSTQGFHAVMNLLLMPMWLLSGAFFPQAGAPRWLDWTMRLNPLTYGNSLLRRVLYRDPGKLGEAVPSWSTALTVVAAWASISFLIDLWIVRRESRTRREG
jgi:ABC-2 type transport system permease protein